MQRTNQILREHKNSPRLPPAAAEKLDQIEIASAGLMAESRAASERHMGLQRTLDALESELVIAKTGGPGGSRSAQRSQIEEIEAAIKIQKLKIRKSEDAQAKIEERRFVANGLYRIQYWLSDLGNRDLYPFVGEIKPKVGARETKPEAIERIRREIEERRADRHRVASAPIPLEEAKAALRMEIAALAEAGAPSVDALMEGGKVRWPQADFTRSDGATLVHDVFDPKSLIVWLHRDAILAKLEADLDTTVDLAACLSADQRLSEDRRLRAEILRLEREEEA